MHSSHVQNNNKIAIAVNLSAAEQDVYMHIYERRQAQVPHVLLTGPKSSQQSPHPDHEHSVASQANLQRRQAL